jgi:hypothetical protein
MNFLNLNINKTNKKQKQKKNIYILNILPLQAIYSNENIRKEILLNRVSESLILN